MAFIGIAVFQQILPSLEVTSTSSVGIFIAEKIGYWISVLLVRCYWLVISIDVYCLGFALRRCSIQGKWPQSNLLPLSEKTPLSLVKKTKCFLIASGLRAVGLLFALFFSLTPPLEKLKATVAFSLNVQVAGG